MQSKCVHHERTCVDARDYAAEERPDRIPVLIHLRQPVAVAAKTAQLWAFKRIRAAARKRWLAALRVIMSSLGPAIAD